MLCAFGHRVAMYCSMLGVVGPNWTIFKLEPTTPNMSQHGGQTIATCCANNVAICCVGLLRSFGRGLRHTESRSSLVCNKNIKEDIPTALEVFFCFETKTKRHKQILHEKIHATRELGLVYTLNLIQTNLIQIKFVDRSTISRRVI